MLKNYFPCYSQVKITIMSRGRGEKIVTHFNFDITDDVKEKVVVCCPESEVDEYLKTCKGFNVIPYPDKVIGVGPTRNWIINNFDENIVLILDDDIEKFGYKTFCEVNVLDKHQVLLSLLNLCQMANDMEVVYFGVPTTRFIGFRENDFLKFNSLPGAVNGIIGKDNLFNEKIMYRTEVDFLLNNLLEKRFVLCDNRLKAFAVQNDGFGGAYSFKNGEMLNQELSFLKNKWGGHFYFKNKKNKISEQLVFKVKRRQETNNWIN